MSEEAFSLIRYIISYVKINYKCEIDVLTKEIILPFTAILSIYLKKSKNQQKLTQLKDDLIEKSIQSISHNNNSLINTSIDTILINHLILIQSNFISINKFIQILSILMEKLINNDEYYSNKMILIKTILNLLRSSYQDQFDSFKKKYLTYIFKFISSNLNDFYNNRNEFKYESINIDCVDKKEVYNHFNSLKTEDEIIKSIYLYEYICYHQFELKLSEETIDLIFKTIHKKVENKEFNDVYLITQFMLNNQYKEKIIENDEIPISIKKYFELNIEYSEFTSIDELLTNILADKYLNKDDDLLQKLNDLLIRDEDNLFCYLSFLVKINEDISLDQYLSLYYDEYSKYKEMFIKVTNLYYYYNKDKQFLMTKNNFELKKLPISSLATTIISKLLDSIKSNPKNFQAFFCLRSIASTIPNVFQSNIQQIFDIVLKSYDNIYLIFEDNSNNEDNMLLAKTAYTSMSFLLTTMYSYIILEYFLDWIFDRIESFSNSQVFGFVAILRLIVNDPIVNLIMPVYIEKYDVLNKIVNLLKREVNESEIFKKNYKISLFFYIQKIYYFIINFTPYVIVQSQLMSQLEKPFSTVYSKIFSSFPYHGIKGSIILYNISEDFDDFVNSLEGTRSFWLTHDRVNQNVKKIDKDELISKLIPKDNYDIPQEYLTLEKPVTIRMAKILVMSPYYVYSYFLNHDKYEYVKETGEILIKTKKEINKLRLKALTNPDDDNDDVDVETLNPIDRFLPLICNHSMIYNIVDQIASNNYLIETLDAIFLIEIFVVLFIEQISQMLSIYHFFPEKIFNLINFLHYIKNCNNFIENFLDLCGNNLINIVLLPNNRCNKMILLGIFNLLVDLDIKLPNHAIQLICYLIFFNDPETILCALKLLKKFDNDQLKFCHDIILDCFDREFEERKNISLIFDFCKYYPSILKERALSVFSLLEEQLSKYKDKKDQETFEFICSGLNGLAPNRSDSTSLSTVIENTASTIPEKIRNTSPQFWSLFEQCQQTIIEKVQEDPLLLKDKLSFLLQYPELLAFSIRSSYFRKIMKKRINSNSMLEFTVDFNHLLQTSFNSLYEKQAEDFLQNFKIHVEGSIVIDAGGVTKEWFTRLAKEIFNQNYALFNCNGNKKSYMPNDKSYIHPDHLNYFKFAGMFIARALIEGICIDAHLTSSFCKQILHRKTNLKDLEDVDESLFNSFQWILENNVEQLSLYFEMDVDEFVEHKTIELKENGFQIEVTKKNKFEYVNLCTNYVLYHQIQKQIEAFCCGFDELIPHKFLRLFTANELDLLICGVPSIDLNDFKENMTYESPYNKDSPVINIFFEAISKWDNEDLAKLLFKAQYLSSEKNPKKFVKLNAKKIERIIIQQIGKVSFSEIYKHR